MHVWSDSALQGFCPERRTTITKLPLQDPVKATKTVLNSDKSNNGNRIIPLTHERFQGLYSQVLLEIAQMKYKTFILGIGFRSSLSAQFGTGRVVLSVKGAEIEDPECARASVVKETSEEWATFIEWK